MLWDAFGGLGLCSFEALDVVELTCLTQAPSLTRSMKSRVYGVFGCM